MLKKLKRKIYRKIVRKFLYWCGYRYCKTCRKFSYITTVKDVVLFEDEPPMFYHFKCNHCGAESPMAASRLTEEVVRERGYKDFNDFAEKNLNKEKVA